MQLTATSPFVSTKNLIESHTAVKLVPIYLLFEVDAQ